MNDFTEAWEDYISSLEELRDEVEKLNKSQKTVLALLENILKNQHESNN